MIMTEEQYAVLSAMKPDERIAALTTAAAWERDGLMTCASLIGVLKSMILYTTTAERVAVASVLMAVVQEYLMAVEDTTV